MYKKKDRWLIAILCVNALLLTMVVMNFVHLPQAQAQSSRSASLSGTGDYLLVPGKIQSNEDAIWVLDVKNEILTNCMYNRNRREIQFGQFMDLQLAFDSFKIPQTPEGQNQTERGY